MLVTAEEVSGFSLTAMQWVFSRIPYLTTQEKAILQTILQSLHIMTDSDNYWFDGQIPGIKPELVKELSIVTGGDLGLPQIMDDQRNNLAELDMMYRSVWHATNHQYKSANHARNPDQEFEYAAAVIDSLRVVPISPLVEQQPDYEADFNRIAIPVNLSLKAGDLTIAGIIHPTHIPFELAELTGKWEELRNAFEHTYQYYLDLVFAYGSSGDGAPAAGGIEFGEWQRNHLMRRALREARRSAERTQAERQAEMAYPTTSDTLSQGNPPARPPQPAQELVEPAPLPQPISHNYRVPHPNEWALVAVLDRPEDPRLLNDSRWDNVRAAEAARAGGAPSDGGKSKKWAVQSTSEHDGLG